MQGVDHSRPGIIGDLHDANLNVVQGLRGRGTAVVTVDPSAVVDPGAVAQLVRAADS